MADNNGPNHVTQLLDDIARDAMTATEDELRAQLSDAGVDPDGAVLRAKAIGRDAVATVQRNRIASLPDEVPDDPGAVRALLDQLLAMPGAPAEGFTMAFRDEEEQSEHDLRLLTSHLLELVKRNHGNR